MFFDFPIIPIALVALSQNIKRWHLLSFSFIKFTLTQRQRFAPVSGQRLNTQSSFSFLSFGWLFLASIYTFYSFNFCRISLPKAFQCCNKITWFEGRLQYYPFLCVRYYFMVNCILNKHIFEHNFSTTAVVVMLNSVNLWMRPFIFSCYLAFNRLLFSAFNVLINS